MASAVTFFTKCWENDYRRLLAEGGVRDQIERCLYRFARRMVLVNNVEDVHAAWAAARSARLAGHIDAFRFVRDHAQRALDFFGLRREDLGRGYVYSICEMAEILLCESPYLLHMAGDVALAESAAWVDRAVEILEADARVAVVNPLWNGRLAEARAEALEDRGDRLLGAGFSDQCYLIRVADFRGDVLRERHPVSEARYPRYGGELFEKRVDAWMRQRGRLRATLPGVSYVHPYPAGEPRREVVWSSAGVQ